MCMVEWFSRFLNDKKRPNLRVIFSHWNDGHFAKKLVAGMPLLFCGTTDISTLEKGICCEYLWLHLYFFNDGVG